MNDIDDLLQQIPLDQIADRLGVSTAEAEGLTRRAVPALLAGMEANAQDPGGAQSLARALGQHQGGAGFDLTSADPSDGASIVGHIFGDNQEQVVSRLGGSDQGGLMQKLLPMLAPLILSWLAGKVLGGAGGEAAAVLATSLAMCWGVLRSSQLIPDHLGGGGLGDILGDVLGGGAGGGSGGGLGDILGGMLGKKGGSHSGTGLRRSGSRRPARRGPQSLT